MDETDQLQRRLDRLQELLHANADKLARDIIAHQIEAIEAELQTRNDGAAAPSVGATPSRA